jgi:23S rRNA pseudoU1915 N3-methylase RlmH
MQPIYKPENDTWDAKEVPKTLQFINNCWITASGEAAPECFGELWDGVGVGGQPECKSGCDFGPVCMELTAKRGLAAAKIRMGEGHSLTDISADMGISEVSLIALDAYARGGPSPLGQVTKKKAPPPLEAPSAQSAKDGAPIKVKKYVKVAKAPAESTPIEVSRPEPEGDKFQQAWVSERKEYEAIPKNMPPGKRVYAKADKGRVIKALDIGYELDDRKVATMGEVSSAITGKSGVEDFALMDDPNIP